MYNSTRNNLYTITFIGLISYIYRYIYFSPHHRRSDMLGLILDCSRLVMVYIEVAAAASRSTTISRPFPAAFDLQEVRLVIAESEKTYTTSSPPCSLFVLPGAKVLDKVTK